MPRFFLAVIHERERGTSPKLMDHTSLLAESCPLARSLGPSRTEVVSTRDDGLRELRFPGLGLV